MRFRGFALLVTGFTAGMIAMGAPGVQSADMCINGDPRLKRFLCAPKGASHLSMAVKNCLAAVSNASPKLVVPSGIRFFSFAIASCHWLFREETKPDDIATVSTSQAIKLIFEPAGMVNHVFHLTHLSFHYDVSLTPVLLYLVHHVFHLHKVPLIRPVPSMALL